jgi:hypothetical protein
MRFAVRGGRRPQMILLFLITPTIRELIVATPLSPSSPSLPASRLLPPRSGLERSDFVLWPDADLVQRLFLSQLLGAKRTHCAHRELFRI